MSSHTKPAETVRLIMSHGAGDIAAAALARALGLSVHEFDLAKLTACLEQGHRCVVVWSDPCRCVAEALRKHTSPSIMAESWRKSTEDLLHLFFSHRRLLLLVAADLIQLGGPVDIMRLADRLPLSGPVALATTIMPRVSDDYRQGDLYDPLARLIVAQYRTLCQLWDELLINSLSLPDQGPKAVDLDALCDILAQDQAEMARLRSQVIAASRQHLAETTLLNDVAKDTSKVLNVTAQDLAASTARDPADVRLLRQQDLEIQRLRAQIAELTNHRVLTGAKIDWRAEDAKDSQERTRTKAEPVFGRDNLSAACEPMGAVGTAPIAEMSEEIALLREQLVSVTALLRIPPSFAPSTAPAIVEAMTPSDLGQIETAFSALLSALETETDLRLRAQKDITTQKEISLPGAKRKSASARSATRL
jgi:hypothetical protein